jgi:hypothetical protein
MKRGLLLASAAALLAVVAVAAQKLHLLSPPIVGHVSCDDWRDCRAASREFAALVQRRIPTGSNQSLVENELLKQGFHHLPPSITRCYTWKEQKPLGVEMIDCPRWDSEWNPRHYLSYDFAGPLPVCGRNVSVLWSSDRAGKIIHIEGYYQITCL